MPFLFRPLVLCAALAGCAVPVPDQAPYVLVPSQPATAGTTKRQAQTYPYGYAYRPLYYDYAFGQQPLGFSGSWYLCCPGGAPRPYHRNPQVQGARRAR